jgi:YcxB-like protein
MKLHYEVTLDDLVAFNRYHWGRSPTIRRIIRSQQWSIAIFLFSLFALGGAAISFFENDPIPALVFTGIGSVLAAMWFVWFPGHYRNTMDKNVRRLYAEGSKVTAVGWHELELGDEMLIERNECGELRTRYAKIERIETSTNYLFIYLSSVLAHIVPLDDSTEGDPLLFRDALQRRMDGIKETAIQAIR